MTTWAMTLPSLPSRQLSPNARVHYMQLHKAKMQALHDTVLLAKSIGAPDKPFSKAHVSITFVAKDKRRRDMDNLFASLKPTIDALTVARVVEDDSVFVLSYSLFYEVGKQEQTIIKIEEIE